MVRESLFVYLLMSLFVRCPEPPKIDKFLTPKLINS